MRGAGGNEGGRVRADAGGAWRRHAIASGGGELHDGSRARRASTACRNAAVLAATAVCKGRALGRGRFAVRLARSAGDGRVSAILGSFGSGGNPDDRAVRLVVLRRGRLGSTLRRAAGAIVDHDARRCLGIAASLTGAVALHPGRGRRAARGRGVVRTSAGAPADRGVRERGSALSALLDLLCTCCI